MTRHGVVRFDLRRTNGARAAELARMLVKDGPERHLGRLLVLDDADRLLPHWEAFEVLGRSRLVETLVCVAVGRPGDGAPLEVPGNLLAGQDSGVFWVPDRAGVDWRVGAPAATRRDARDGPEGGLTALLEILQAPEVFDRAGELAARVPGGVCNPGLRLAEVVADESEFQPSLLSAIDRLLEHGGPRGQHAAVADVADFCDRPASGQVALREGSPLRGAHIQAVRASEATQEIIERLPELFSLIRAQVPVVELITDAGDRLADLRERWQRLFDGAPADTELDRTQHKRLEAQGVTVPPPAHFDAERVQGAVDRYVSGGLARGVSLGELVDGLRELEEKLTRNGTDHTSRLDQACPPSLLARLRRPLPFPRPEPWLPLAGFAVAALAGLAPFGVAAGLVTAAAWTALIALTVVRGPGGDLIDQVPALVANGLAGAVGGLGAGLAIGGSVPAAAWAGALLATVAGAAWAVARSWRSRANHWMSESELERVVRVPDELRAAASGLAAGWTGATERINTADAVIRARVAIDGVAQELRHQADELRPTIPAGGLCGALAATVREHLTDLVGAALRPRWQELSAGQSDVHRMNARRATARLLADWKRHVAEHGPIEPPPFATREDDRIPAVSGEDLEAMALAAAHGNDDVMWQLCDAADLALLDPGPAGLPVLRFAPRAGLAAIGDRLPSETLWISSPRHSGVLRLVPVRPDLVAVRWAASDEQPEEMSGEGRDEQPGEGGGTPR